MMKSSVYPAVTVTDEGKAFLLGGQSWMYRNNLKEMEQGAENGRPVRVIAEDGTYIGTGFLSGKSHITVRILTRDPDQLLDSSFFRQRIESAWRFRKTTERENIDNCRLIFGESDLLSGLTVDRYNEILSVQITSAGMEMIKDDIYETLLEVLNSDGQNITGIYERNDLQARKKEGLPLYKGFWKECGASGKTVISENGLKLNVDYVNGQKTGYFLDQKSNRMLIRKLAEGKKVLDCFTHTGGFALNAAMGNAQSVKAVDVSASALAQAKENAELNGLEDRMEFIQADVFDYLQECREGEFDLIILDPPAFTKSRRTVDHAYQGYKRINLNAMKLLKDEGYLATCSCSRYMETELFEQMLRDAAQEAGVYLKQISVTQQNGDHPILWTAKDTSYLKFYIFQIIGRNA